MFFSSCVRQSKDDSSSDSDSKGGGGESKPKAKEDSSSSKKKEEKSGGGWAPPPMTASTSGGDVGAAASVAKSATAVHAHSGGGRPEAGAGGQKWGSSINLSGEDMHMPLRPPPARSFRRVGISRVPSSPSRGPFNS